MLSLVPTKIEDKPSNTLFNYGEAQQSSELHAEQQSLEKVSEKENKEESKASRSDPSHSETHGSESSQENIGDRSVTSAKYTEIAGNYWDEMVERVMNDYSDRIQATEQNEESDPEYDSNNKEQPNDTSIEKRIDDSSIEQSINQGRGSKTNLLNDVADGSSVSSVRNIANDYVANVLDGII